MTIIQKSFLSVICWVLGMWILIDINYWLAISTFLIMHSNQLANSTRLQITADKVLNRIKVLNAQR